MKKVITLLFVLGLTLAPMATTLAVVNTDDPFGVEYAEDVGLGSQEIQVVAVNVIQSLLGLLGILALIIILIGGFRWMTAAGNIESIDKAKKIISSSVVGLLIIFFAYAITVFIFRVVFDSARMW